MKIGSGPAAVNGTAVVYATEADVLGRRDEPDEP